MRKVQLLKGQRDVLKKEVWFTLGLSSCVTVTPVRCGDVVTAAALTESAVGVDWRVKLRGHSVGNATQVLFLLEF